MPLMSAAMFTQRRTPEHSNTSFLTPLPKTVLKSSSSGPNTFTTMFTAVSMGNHFQATGTSSSELYLANRPSVN